jgi:hypothetical protein
MHSLKGNRYLLQRVRHLLWIKLPMQSIVATCFLFITRDT